LKILEVNISGDSGKLPTFKYGPITAWITGELNSVGMPSLEDEQQEKIAGVL